MNLNFEITKPILILGGLMCLPIQHAFCLRLVPEGYAFPSLLNLLRSQKESILCYGDRIRLYTSAKTTSKIGNIEGIAFLCITVRPWEWTGWRRGRIPR